jgi:hypothetical protein
VAKLEQGRRPIARITSLASLARALDVELSALVERATPLLVSPSSSPDAASRLEVQRRWLASLSSSSFASGAQT